MKITALTITTLLLCASAVQAHTSMTASDSPAHSVEHLLFALIPAAAWLAWKSAGALMKKQKSNDKLPR